MIIENVLFEEPDIFHKLTLNVITVLEYWYENVLTCANDDDWMNDRN